MRYQVTPLSPVEVVALPARLRRPASAARDVRAWLDEVRTCRCRVDQTNFALTRGEAPDEVLGYLLGFERHGGAVCTHFVLDPSVDEDAAGRLVRAFMDRLTDWAVQTADFRVEPSDDRARAALCALGGQTLDTPQLARFADRTPTVIRLAANQSGLCTDSLAGRSEVPASLPSAPTPMDIGFGPRGGYPSLRLA
jgi:hypothetical protein